MKIYSTQIIEKLTNLGIKHYGIVPVSEIIFNDAFREVCASNQCGKYNTNWACPPGVGETTALFARARQFQYGMVIQTVWPLEDQFDLDGMMNGGKQHNVLFKRVRDQITLLFATNPILALSAGACSMCETCTYPAGTPCRLPDQAIASLESYCIDVARLIASSGLSYRNGANTVSYVGLILY